ncbi:MAG: 5'-nucleotidase C-terminal domain-containing protein [Ardenticatenales bacterium]|nr:5'-nucleotidase C-terminal domain-containing protein [Ardenticatenales bacterium]
MKATLRSLGHRRIAGILMILALLALVPVMASAKVAPQAPVVIQFLDISDWHGQLDPLSVTIDGAPQNVGGASGISAYWQQDRAAIPNTLTLTGGDAFGATPPLSNYFNDVPAVKAQRMMGFNIDTFGNHNFDRGITHLQQMIDLAGAPTSAEAPGTPFHYVSANLANVDANLDGVERYRIFDMAGVKVAVIGITNPEAPSLVFPGSFGTITITDPIAGAMAARTDAIAEGAQVIVAITHMGIVGENSQGEPVGPLVNFAKGVTGFDIIFGDHTDEEYMATINGALVLENRSKGRTYAKVRLTYETTTSTVISKTAEFITPVVTIDPETKVQTPRDPAIDAMLQPYRDELANVYDQHIGVAAAIFPRGSNVERLGEVALGDLVADSMRLKYGTQLGFTNGGGIRSALPSSYKPANINLRRPGEGYREGPPYDIVLGDIYAVLPFGNQVVTRRVTGGQLWQMLELGVSALPSSNGRFPQISGFRYTYDLTPPAGASRIISVTLNNGTPILSDTTQYTLATNDFVNAGGDGYTMLNDGQGTTRDIMANVFADHVRNLGYIEPTVDCRIRSVDPAPLLGVTPAHRGYATTSLPVYFRAYPFTCSPDATYTWSFGDGGTASGITTTHAFTETGRYTVTVIAMNSVSTVTGTLGITVTVPMPLYLPVAIH